MGKKFIPVLLLLAVLVISGCTQLDTSTEPAGDFTGAEEQVDSIFEQELGNIPDQDPELENFLIEQ